MRIRKGCYTGFGPCCQMTLRTKILEGRLWHFTNFIGILHALRSVLHDSAARWQACCLHCGLLLLATWRAQVVPTLCHGGSPAVAVLRKSNVGAGTAHGTT